MPDLKQFTLPDVGEGLTEADIIKWEVHPGDAVVVNQILVEIETAKAAVELPSPYAGIVAALHVAEGDTVDVGRPIITIDVDPAAKVGDHVGTGAGAAGADRPTDADPARSNPGALAAADATPAAPTESNGAGAGAGRQPMLVGYGPKAEGMARRRARSTDAAHAGVLTGNARPAATAPPVAAQGAASSAVAATQAAVLPPAASRALAKPPVRLLAKSLGIDLDSVVATGPNGTVSRADVEQAADADIAAEVPALSRPVARRTGGERSLTRVPVKGVRKNMAVAMVESAFSAPHVSVFMTVDVSPMMELRQRIQARPEFRGVKVSPLLFLAKAVILAAVKTPEINASWDAQTGEIVLKHYVNLGIAAATGRGLIVPNIKDADQLSLLELATAIADLTEVARSGKTAPGDMSGGTITITNVGVFGVDTGTPILNPGETGILAFGAVRRMPWVVDEQIVPRWVTQLAVSFDHRVVDGQQGSKFLADVAGILADPGLALL